MEVKFLGDLHAERASIVHFKRDVIQVGDLDLFGYDWWGYQFSTDAEWREFYGKDFQVNHDFVRFNSPPVMPGRRYFIDGNHDHFPSLNPDAKEPYLVKPNLVYIPRGYVSGEVMFIGGAESIDRAMRIPYYSWFPEEQFSRVQENRIMSYDGPIDVIVAHDLPLSAAAEILRRGRRGEPVGFYSSKFLEEVWKKFKPSVWVCGHFHLNRTFLLEGDGFNTQFVACDINQTKELDIPLAPDFFKREWGKQQ